MKNRGGTLHTLSGPIFVQLRPWRCVCGFDVLCDGAQDGFFAASTSTVFTPAFIDVCSQMVFTRHRTL